MNNNQEQQNNIQESVLKKIRNGEVTMTPHFYYVLKIIAVSIVALLVLITSALLISFIIFSLSITGKLFLLGFGWQGIQVFFMLFPWTLLLIEVVLIFILEWLLKQFKFGYRSPVIYIVAGLILVSLIIAIIINSTRLHNVLLHQAEHQQLPIIGGMYAHLRMPHDQQVFRGTVSSINGNVFILNPDRFAPDATSTDIMSRVVILPPGVNGNAILHTGDRVIVAGNPIGTSSIQAFGIHELPPADE